jgi:cytochrome c553
MRVWRVFGASVAVLGAALITSGRALTQEPPAGDPERGETLAYTCLGCHGVPNYKNAYPNYSVPKLNGQHRDYVIAALHAYRNGERSHATMHSQAASLSDRDMADIAAYLAGDPLKPGEPEGKAPEVAQTCEACHGKDGVGITPLYPTLSGQHADYLARALLEYKKGGRKNPIMSNFATQLTGEQMEALAEYYAAQKPALATFDKPASRFTAGR